jgi:hypothetical protein
MKGQLNNPEGEGKERKDKVTIENEHSIFHPLRRHHTGQMAPHRTLLLQENGNPQHHA